jgi:hypothetical protein
LGLSARYDGMRFSAALSACRLTKYAPRRRLLD